MNPTDDARVRTVQSALQRAEGQLADAGIENAALKAEWLLAHVLGCPRLQLALAYRRPLTDKAYETFIALVKRALSNEPVQYITGETSFMGYPIHCDPRALIPRPETERLVDVVLHTAAIWRKPAPRIVDVGTGSGCIAVALAKAKPEANITAVDCSPDALALAAENARLNGVKDRITLIQSDLLEACQSNTFDAVVANLPYIPHTEYAKLPAEVRAFEPVSALDGGPDGLTLIRRLLPQAFASIGPRGWIFLEIGADQSEPVKRLMDDAGWMDAETLTDLARRDRIVKAMRP